MGHNHSTLSRNKLNKKSNSTNCKLSMIKTQPFNNGNRKKRLTLKLPLSQPSLSSETSLSPRFSASISSISSADFDVNHDVMDKNVHHHTIKDMMVEILDNKMCEKTTHNSPDSKLLPTTSDVADYEKFFISFHQKQQQIRDDMAVYDAVIQHRVAFVSLVGLYQSFRRVPTHILFSSLFILKIRREWLYDTASYQGDTNNVLHSLQYDEDEEFMMLLKWKDTQGLLVFMWNSNEDCTHDDDGDNHVDEDIDAMDSLPTDFGIESDDDFDLIPDHNSNVNEDSVPLPLPRLQRNESQYNLPNNLPQLRPVSNESPPAEANPMWIHLSRQLSTIYDAYRGSNFMPLILDKNWWLNDFEESQYGASPQEILNEINACHMNYRCVMEILFQSNPSLIPCKTYKDLVNISTTVHHKARPKKIELSEINAISNTMSTVDSVEYLDEREFTPYSPTDYWNRDDDLDNIFNMT